MSVQLISPNADIERLISEGYHVVIHPESFLLVHDVPYVTSEAEVQRGTLVFALGTAGDVVADKPPDHVGKWIGAYPCDKKGQPLEQLRHVGAEQLAPDLATDYSFSSKRRTATGTEDYPDWYSKVTAYVAIMEQQANGIDPAATAKTHPVIRPLESNSVFKYTDSGAARSGIVMVKRKLELDRVAIVGLGGTGSYVLDHVAKTDVREIHLYDGDEFLTHNAFRAPGAFEVEELRRHLNKAEFWRAQYEPLRDGLVAHPYYLDESNCADLAEMSFVFLCLDVGTVKGLLADKMEAADIPFVDVGMGLYEAGGSIGGTLRTTLSLPGHRGSFRRRVPLGVPTDNDLYDRNIQVDDLNALNGVLAVIAWKKYLGFYQDTEQELNSTYTVEMQMLHREDHREP